MLSDADVLDAVRGYVERRGDVDKVGLPETVRITWRSLVEGEVVRSVETRVEARRVVYGHMDLSGRAEYDSLPRQRVAPPKDLAEARTVKLVRRGTVSEELCPCGNGEVTCPRCQGRTDLPCDSTVSCPACRSLDSCLLCQGSGQRRRGAAEESRAAEDRVTCRVCGVRSAACRTCEGRGRVVCGVCEGVGLRGCPDCDEGTVPHERCRGAGRRVTWVEGTVRQEPVVEKVKHPGAGVPYLAWSWAREHGDWSRFRLTGKDTTPPATAGLADLLRPHLVPREGEIAREADFAHLRLARAVTAQHPHRVYYVIPTATGPQTLMLPTARRTFQALTAAVAVVVLILVLVRVLS